MLNFQVNDDLHYMKCIIFDCDGVLVDSEIITTKYFIKHLHVIGYQISIEDAIKRFTGKSNKTVYEEISKETGILFTSKQINHIQEQVHHALHAEVPAINGIAELLAALEKNSAKICVASSGTLDKINTSLNVTGLKKYFSENQCRRVCRLGGTLRCGKDHSLFFDSTILRNQ